MGQTPAGRPVDQSSTSPLFAAGQLLAVNASPDALAKAKSMGFSVVSTDQIATINSQVVHLGVPAGWSNAEAMRLLQGSVSVSVLLNNLYRPILGAADVDASRPASGSIASSSGGCPKERCYAPATIAWNSALAQCSRGLRVGIIDTGIDAHHPALMRQSVQIGTVLENERAASTAHGTGVLALLAGEPDSSTPGLISKAQFYAADIFFADQHGAPVSDTVHLLRALDWLDAWDVKIINLSLTGPRDDLVEKAIARLASRGVLIVAAAGNEGPNAPLAYPAAYPDVIAVTAVDRQLRSYRYANQGDYIDLAAPGVDIWTALPNGRQGTLTGTSLAAPFASAVLATVYNGLAHKTKAAAMERLRFADLGRPGRDPVYGNGLVLAPTSCTPGPGAGPGVADAGGAPVVRAADKPASKAPTLVSPSAF